MKLLMDFENAVCYTEYRFTKTANQRKGVVQTC